MKHHSNHIAVWMDYSTAKLVYPKGVEYQVEIVGSSHDIHPREDGQHSDHTRVGKNRESNNEYSRHHKEMEQLHSYYHILEKVLRPYDEILLLGPTKAKDELFNILMDDKTFNGKRIELEKSDKMTEPQLLAFVKDYFAEKVKAKK